MYRFMTTPSWLWRREGIGPLDQVLVTGSAVVPGEQRDRH